MPSPDYRRDKALEDIAKHLGDISKSLKVLAKNSGSTTTVFNSLQDQARPDAFDVPQEPQPGEVIATSEPGKDADVTHPYAHKGGYFARSTPEDEREHARRAEGIGYEGPYGDGNGQPYG